MLDNHHSNFARGGGIFKKAKSPAVFVIFYFRRYFMYTILFLQTGREQTDCILGNSG